MLRLENIADKFDLTNDAEVPYIKIDELAKSLYQFVNGGQAVTLYTIISETSLTANQLYNQMEANKI